MLLFLAIFFFVGRGANYRDEGSAAAELRKSVLSKEDGLS